MAKYYPVNERNIFEYKTNQVEEIIAGSKLNKNGFPLIWPTRNENNSLVFISFVKAEIRDLNGNLVSEGPATFDILDTETFSKKDKDALNKVRYISALLSPNYRVTGGVYLKGKYYTGQMNKKYATTLYEAFMSKYFFIENRDVIEDKFDKNEDGHYPFWPSKDEKGNKIIFSAVNASIYDLAKNEVIRENLNFNIIMGRSFDLDKKEDRDICDTIFMMLDRHYVVKGFYYGGKLIPNKLSQAMKLYLEKGFIKKNFLIEQLDYLIDQASTNDKGELLFFPMKNKKGDKIVVSFTNGSTPFGDEYSQFDIASNVPFDPRLKENQYKIQIIDRIIQKNEAFSGSLYLDGVLVPGTENHQEIERRKAKVEKELKVRLDGDDDYIKIFNRFTTDDREKLLMLSDSYRSIYPIGKEVVYKNYIDYDKKVKKNVFVFDCVNVLDKYGNFRLENHYTAVYDDVFEANETEKLILKHVFRKHSYVRGGVYVNGVNINRKLSKAALHKALRAIRPCLSTDDMKDVEKSTKLVGVKYKMDRKSGMFVHWPTFDINGREQILSVVDANVWFKVGKNTVKAANDMNFNIFAGETFGLVGESGSGKTTISRAILGINKLNKGGIYWKGKLISSGLSRRDAKAIKKNIQMIFQDPAASLNERANVDYIVSEGLYSFHLFKSKQERLNKVIAMLREVGLLPEHLSRYPHEFSGGQRQRIGIARALVIEPELVLADEPISALDVSIRAQVLNLLKRLQNSENLTYLFIAHDLSIIRYISDRIAVMHNGYVVELGIAEEIYSNPLHPYTKSLLTAIPQPDPKSKDTRVKIAYEQGNIKYEECRWVEFRPGHFVLVNDELKEKISREIAE